MAKAEIVLGESGGGGTVQIYNEPQYSVPSNKTITVDFGFVPAYIIVSIVLDQRYDFVYDKDISTTGQQLFENVGGSVTNWTFAQATSSHSGITDVSGTSFTFLVHNNYSVSKVRIQAVGA